MDRLTEYAQLLLTRSEDQLEDLFSSARTQCDDKYEQLRGTLPHYKYRHYYSDIYYGDDLINSLLQQCELYWDVLREQYNIDYETTGVLRHLWIPSQPAQFNSHVDPCLVTLKIGEKLQHQSYRSLLGEVHTGSKLSKGVPHAFKSHNKLDRQVLVYFIVNE